MVEIRRLLPMLIVEFVGLPGVGKTTVATRFAEIAIERGYRAAVRPSLGTSQYERVKHSARFILFRVREWRLVAALTGFLFAWRPWRWHRYKAAKQLLFLSFYVENQAEGEPEVLILDQGPVQCTWGASVFSELERPHLIAAVLSRIYRRWKRPVIFVLIEADAALAAGRVSQRKPGKYRFSGRRQKDARSVYEKHVEILESFVQQAQHLIGARVVRLDGRLSPVENAERLARSLSLTPLR